MTAMKCDLPGGLEPTVLLLEDVRSSASLATASETPYGSASLCARHAQQYLRDRSVHKCSMSHCKK